MNSDKRLKLALLSLLFSTVLAARPADSLRVELSVGADVVNHYVWRGLLLGDAPAIQPSMSVSYRGFSFGSWASYSVSPADFQEVDLYFTYTAGSFTFGINDYYNPVDIPGFDDQYFDFGRTTTLHSLEPFITVSEIAGTKFSATAAVFVYGNDRDAEDRNYYSSYFELGYSTTVNDFGLDIFGGATFNEGYYADHAAIVNLGLTISKEIGITQEFTVPCWGSFILNPYAENVFFVIGFSF